jgi:putative hydrolase of the HAD superfamily
VRWLLCDYGNVLSLPQPAADIERLAALGGFEPDELERRYWLDREAYDRADLDAATYWARTLDPAGNGARSAPPAPPAPVEPDRLDALIAADVASWLHLRTPTIAAVGRAAQRGYRLALLSNAPVEVARGIDGLPALAGFSPRLFSCDLRAVKPEPVAYERALAALAATDASTGAATGARSSTRTSAEVVFVDDRPSNVTAAEVAGLKAVLYEDPGQIDAL